METSSHRATPFSIQGSVSIVKNCECFLCSEHKILLNSIAVEGSINAAAKKLGISYQNAWKIVEQINHQSPIPMIICRRGGKAGGGAELTSYGRKLIDEMNQIEMEFAEFLIRINKRFDICF